MITPKLSENERERLVALNSYRILHTPPEKEYDEITKLASLICNAPTSHISFMDSDNQWTKSCLGMDGKDIKRELTFCGHTILNKIEPLIIPDTSKDIRFHDNPFVKGDPYFAFYAGFPLVNPEGHSLGTLCVLDKEPRELDSDQIMALKVLSNQILKLLELRRKNIALNETIQYLNIKNQRLNDFVKVTAHDIKSPLSSLVMLADALQDEYWDSLNSEVKNIVDHINQSGTYLSDLVDGILKNSKKIDDSHLDKEEIQVKTNVGNLISVLDVFEEVNFNIEISDELEIYTNKTAFNQILTNLINNSIKYNDKEVTEITITITEDIEFVVVNIIDNGLGIKEDELHGIFNLFSTTSNTDREGFQGTGIGLTTVKSLVESLGGTISVNSKYGEGTHFRFTLKK
ncbi:sensor histidine kinase [Gaetbulibacter aestuarii]|uniref:histidine kinase n=1 Tax=Gaetbulibacter aestuarii TaxID=1502358 RepID=A0ABW7MZ79_9FLAO